MNEDLPFPNQAFPVALHAKDERHQPEKFNDVLYLCACGWVSNPMIATYEWLLAEARYFADSTIDSWGEAEGGGFALESIPDFPWWSTKAGG